ncbi:response regulator, partial [Helicobacter typhlonius]|uniref:response regulator n=1 Tax=Helicobacter typhlonius TaxID=76936 RepID=UPI002FE2BEE7
MRILVIEDDPTLCKNITEALNERSYQTDVAENLKDGEYYISIRNYDLVLADWDLPDGCGLDIVSQVKDWATLLHFIYFCYLLLVTNYPIIKISGSCRNNALKALL